jgi:hypothetical protein
MKKRIIVAAVAVVALNLVGCSSTQLSGPNQEAISQQRIATSEFRKDGIKISYNLSGQLVSIETTGYAATWGNSGNATREAYRVAELEAKKHLNDFINKETITSSVSVKMISQNLEHAEDTSSAKSGSGGIKKPGDVVGSSGTADDLVAVDESVAADSNSTESAKNRKDALKIASTVSTTIRTNNRGILSGLYQVEAKVVDDGKAVKVVYRWEKKNEAGRLQLRNAMAM